MIVKNNNNNNDNNNDNLIDKLLNNNKDKLHNFSDNILNKLYIIAKLKEKNSINIKWTGAIFNKIENIPKNDL